MTATDEQGLAGMSKHVIEVARFINRSPESVYTLLTDHPRLDQFQELSDSVLLRPGQASAHGKGAERRVTIWMFGRLPVRFTEDITLAEEPCEFHYLVSKAHIMLGRLPLWSGVKHHGGEVKVLVENGGCQVHWKSTIEIVVPLVGAWLGEKMRVEGERVFLSVLNQVDQHLLPT